MKNKISMIMVFMASLLSMNMICDWQEREDKKTVIAQQEHYRKRQSVPFYEWSIELDAAIQIYNSRVRDKVRTWTVWRSDYGMIEGDCASLGYPIPYDVQLTNPFKGSSSNSGVAVEQAEPSGLYSSHNSIATWVREVISIQNKTIITAIYIESKVTCYPYPVKVDYEKNRVTPIRNIMPSVTLQDNNPNKREPTKEEELKMQEQLDQLKKKNGKE